jgi:hypothetical protein
MGSEVSILYRFAVFSELIGTASIEEARNRAPVMEEHKPK